ncbi:YisL family protein [Bacillus sp. DX1.1]|uniref:YisL family protein n=1 Tax=unclassified Bacillus (in: firmicutes) TaxID=185979 RepID=UPI0025704E8E|nr:MULTISPECIES: YisL family protein [unclassified Bacillus (in: firmicutes)]MDM5153801.1 YisL family protein [Bacillus sp. DX1.1]WJE82737.1 YisL family protein [Bacillus sp. DX3.1]
MTTHMHITAWALGLILFFVAYSMYTAGRKGKGVHMGLRLMYIIIIVTGFLLYQSIMKTATGNAHMWYGLKMVIGVWVIAAMEMILVKTSKQKQAGAFWVQFIIAFVVVLYLGLRLPIGFSPFA